jgi:hypothetical protein
MPHRVWIVNVPVHEFILARVRPGCPRSTNAERA